MLVTSTQASVDQDRVTRVTRAIRMIGESGEYSRYIISP
jgi:hypothetical protein